jgi:hypothetical protein
VDRAGRKRGRENEQERRSNKRPCTFESIRPALSPFRHRRRETRRNEEAEKKRGKANGNVPDSQVVIVPAATARRASSPVVRVVGAVHGVAASGELVAFITRRCANGMRASMQTEQAMRRGGCTLGGRATTIVLTMLSTSRHALQSSDAEGWCGHPCSKPSDLHVTSKRVLVLAVKALRCETVIGASEQI